jgi:hypothetical protein
MSWFEVHLSTVLSLFVSGVGSLDAYNRLKYRVRAESGARMRLKADLESGIETIRRDAAKSMSETEKQPAGRVWISWHWVPNLVEFIRESTKIMNSFRDLIVCHTGPGNEPVCGNGNNGSRPWDLLCQSSPFCAITGLYQRIHGISVTKEN